MYAITGIDDKADGDIGIADAANTGRLDTAFSGTNGVFILPPSDFDPEPGFLEAKG